MAYFFLGQDRKAKDAKIAELKRKLLTSAEALEFDYESLYAHKLDHDVLKKALIAFPAVARERLVVIRESHRLDPHHKELLLDFFSKKNDKTIIILDSDELSPADSFVKSLNRWVKVMSFGQVDRELNVFDMTKAMGLRRSEEALKILAVLLSQGIHPLQLMGGLVWFWGKSRERLPQEKFKKGLMVLQEADLNIKRSRLKSEYAVEVAVVKLCTLI